MVVGPGITGGTDRGARLCGVGHRAMARPDGGVAEREDGPPSRGWTKTTCRSTWRNWKRRTRRGARNCSGAAEADPERADGRRTSKRTAALGVLVIVVSWNVNSIRTRLARLEALLARHRPDVVCLQELRAGGKDFPAEELAGWGYRSEVFAQAGRNGVALVSREPAEEVSCGFPDDPAEGQARVIAASVSGLHIVNVYVVNGRSVGSAEYGLKLTWLDAFAAWLRDRFDPAMPLLVVGDFNVAPEGRDVHDPNRWRGMHLCSEPERERVDALLKWGLVDLVRLYDPGPGPYTWWDYREGAFHRGWGLRIDLALGTRPVAERCASAVVDRAERNPTFGPGRPSDHAPVIVTLA